MPRRVFSGASSTPSKGSPMKIPLNDDKLEKANRLHSRQAQHEMHMSQIKAAATPLRKRRSLLASSPHTPAQDEDDGLPSISGAAVTPMKRVPIMANFEEWMKMATDNKINATNSWNFALIDYFHDMSLLKEGDGVNFQRASCTLDGCVKIYTNRVDSVATETGKLLSGLADSNSDKRKSGSEDEEGNEDEGDEEDEDGNKKKSRKKNQRTAEATLATSFAQLQLKKMELEFAIDPLFKKASADFDEGGAKGLLLNHLAIDANGRIVFDSSDDAHDLDEADDKELTDEQAAAEETVVQQTFIQPAQEVDMAALASKFLPDLNVLDGLDICPSLKTFELGDSDGSLDLPFLNNQAAWNKDGEEGDAKAEEEAHNSHENGSSDDDEGIGMDFDMPEEIGFGEGGEVWAKEAAMDRQMPVHVLGTIEGEDAMDGMDANDGVDGVDKYGISMKFDGNDQQNILDYFDKTLQKNWAGPEHWKIRKFKDAAKLARAGPTKRKERELFEIDFAAPMSQSMADALYTPVASNATITLPKSQWRSKTRNLLPDDKHFSSRQLLQLFLKPKAMLGRRRHGRVLLPATNPTVGEVDEQYWAKQQNDDANDPDDVAGNYDANFFQDDGFGGLPDADEDDEFADARDHFSPEADGGAPMGDGAPVDGPFGAQLVTQSRRLRPEYVQYARVAKKVDVRRLKEEIWRGLAIDEVSHLHQKSGQQASNHSQNMDKSVASDASSAPLATQTDETFKFTEVLNGLQTVYPKQAMADISTSYCFICVLHLANEKGLTITNHSDFQELTIQKDHTAEIVGMA